MIMLLPPPFRRLWLGQQPLSRAFWFYGLLLFFVLFFVWTLIRAPLRALNLSGLANGLTAVIMWAYSILIWVGIWRSASAYSGEKHWAIAAKVAVCLFAGSMVRGFFMNGGFNSFFGMLASGH
jgi:hypothetical protein